MQGFILCPRKITMRSLLLVFFVSSLLSSCGVISRLFEAPAPKRNFTVEELLIGQEPIPSTWQPLKTFFPYGDPLATNESIAMFYGKTINGEQKAYATQLVYRYETNGVAHREFDLYYPGRYLKSPVEWSFKSSYANESFLGCHEMAGNVGQSCEYAGRYEEFIVVFQTQMIANEMTLIDLEKVANAIDLRMAQYLRKNTPSPNLIKTRHQLKTDQPRLHLG